MSIFLGRNFSRCSFLLNFLFLLPFSAISQTHIKGKVINVKDGKPVAFASVGIGASRKRSNALSDAAGYFDLALNGQKNNDSLFITSIGFKSLKITLLDALSKTEFPMFEQATELPPVILKSYTTEEAVGSNSEVTGYFRSWNHNKTGGEIGKMFYVNHDEYKLDRVRFKVNNQCDTCQIRLHIREMVNDLPGEEILYDSISTEVKKLSFDDKFSEFDLRPYEVILKNKSIFVSLEILGCSKANGTACSICYIGTEHGTFYYKTRKQADWSESGNDYSIYMKLIYKY